MLVLQTEANHIRIIKATYQLEGPSFFHLTTDVLAEINKSCEITDEAPQKYCEIAVNDIRQLANQKNASLLHQALLAGRLTIDFQCHQDADGQAADHQHTFMFRQIAGGVDGQSINLDCNGNYQHTVSEPRYGRCCHATREQACNSMFMLSVSILIPFIPMIINSIQGPA